MNKGLLIIIISMLLIPLINASGTSGWYPLKNSIFSDGYQNPDVTSNMNQNTALNRIMNTGMQTTAVQQGAVQTFLYNGSNYGVYTEGNFIKIFNVESLTLEYVISRGTHSKGNFYVNDIDSDTIPELVFLTSWGIYEVELDGHFNKINETTIPEEWAVSSSSISCYKQSGNSPICAFVSDNKRIVSVNMDSGAFMQYNASYSAGTWTKAKNSSESPILADITQNGSAEGLFFYGISKNRLAYEMIMLNLNNMKPVTAFSADGLYNVTRNGTRLIYYAHQPFIYQADDVYSGSTPYEIAITIMEVSGGTSSRYKNVLLQSDGAVLMKEIPIQDGYATSLTPSYDCPSTAPNICLTQLKYYDYGTFNPYLAIYDGDGSNPIEVSVSGLSNQGGAIATRITQSPAYSADIDGDGLHELITSQGAINLSSALFIEWTSGNFDFPAYSNSTPYPIVLNSQNLALLYMDKNQTILAYSTSANASNKNANLTDSVFQNWVSPVCINTTIIFSAKQYVSGFEQPADTNYYNDYGLDNERLVAECDNPQGARYGEYSSNNPFVNCTYTAEGNYFVTLYIQDDSNENDYSEFENIVIQIVDGTAGETCNIETLQGTTGTKYGTGAPCHDNEECASGYCPYMFCELKGGGHACEQNSQCASGSCINAKCTTPSLWQGLEATKNNAIGDDNKTNNLLAIFIILMGSAVVGGVGALMGGTPGGLIGGVGSFYLLTFATTFIGWLNPLIMLGLLIASLVLFMFGAMLKGSSE